MCKTYKCKSFQMFALGISYLVASTVLLILTALVYVVLYFVNGRVSLHIFLFPLLFFIPPLLDLVMYKYYLHKYSTCTKSINKT